MEPMLQCVSLPQPTMVNQDLWNAMFYLRALTAECCEVSSQTRRNLYVLPTQIHLEIRWHFEVERPDLLCFRKIDHALLVFLGKSSKQIERTSEVHTMIEEHHV